MRSSVIACCSSADCEKMLRPWYGESDIHFVGESVRMKRDTIQKRLPSRDYMADCNAFYAYHDLRTAFQEGARDLLSNV